MLKIKDKSAYNKISFSKGVLFLRMAIDEKVRDIPIHMTKMIGEVKDHESTLQQNQFMITSPPQKIGSVSQNSHP